MDEILMRYLMQLPGRSPSILACVLGLVLTLVLWRRCPRAAFLVCAALGLFLFTTLVMPLVQLYLIFHGPELGFGHSMTPLLFVWSVLNAAAVVLLVIAAFTGRPYRSDSVRPFMEDDEYPPITGKPRDTGIRSYDDRD